MAESCHLKMLSPLWRFLEVMRIGIVICALLLMFDLTSDGCLGKAKFVFPLSATESSIASCPSKNSGKGESPTEPLLTNLLGSLGQPQNQPVAFPIPPDLKKLDDCHIGSSGGIPL